MGDQQFSGRPAGDKAGTVGGGRTTRGPEPDPGRDIEPGGLVPPYEGRMTERGSSESAVARSESIAEQLADADSGNKGATSSPANEQPAGEHEAASDGAAGSGDQTATDTSAASPHGVGVSTGRRGEDIADKDGKEAGRSDGEPDDTPGGRPTGTSDNRDVTGINP